MQALKEAARRGKQVAILIEIAARFDEAPNISCGKELEEAGAHVAYGVERVERTSSWRWWYARTNGIRRYVHVGTGNYHAGTARLYGDWGCSAGCRARRRHGGSLQRADHQASRPRPRAS